ncbi:MAG: 23S rRNA (adenine(2503)-C(2))-methyltransferase RlmN [Pseudomonadota bacterium]
MEQSPFLSQEHEDRLGNTEPTCPQEKTDLTGMTREALEVFMTGLGKERYRAAQLMKWIYTGLALSFDDMTDISKAFRDDLARIARISTPELIDLRRSSDGTLKFLFGMDKGDRVETVMIPEDDHDTLCVSTQVGCAMGCRICRTSMLGLKRNLSSGEIVSQLLAVRRLVPDSRITNVVLMGMGEPLANFENTVNAIRTLTHPNGPGISWRRLTVSTCGLAPQIMLLGEVARVKLAVSLNAVTDEQRDLLMPVNRRYPIAELMAALKAYPLPRRDRITVEYVLVSGVNDSDADAKQLVRLLNPIRAKVNLIPLNDESLPTFQAPSPERVGRFQEVLMSRSLMAIVRKSRGTDILAACGQLAAETDRPE